LLVGIIACSGREHETENADNALKAPQHKTCARRLTIDRNVIQVALSLFDAPTVEGINRAFIGMNSASVERWWSSQNGLFYAHQEQVGGVGRARILRRFLSVKRSGKQAL
jgi:hypothetical protein